VKDKDFDAVRMMRTIRDDLSQRYLKDPEAEERDLQRIREQYGIAPPLAKTTADKCPSD